MKRITNTLTRRIAGTAIKASGAIQNNADRRRAHGERVEAWANRLAVRWGCVDDVLANITSDTLSVR